MLFVTKLIILLVFISLCREGRFENSNFISVVRNGNIPLSQSNAEIPLDVHPCFKLRSIAVYIDYPTITLKAFYDKATRKVTINHDASLQTIPYNIKANGVVDLECIIKGYYKNTLVNDVRNNDGNRHRDSHNQVVDLPIGAFVDLGLEYDYDTSAGDGRNSRETSNINRKSQSNFESSTDNKYNNTMHNNGRESSDMANSIRNAAVNQKQIYERNKATNKYTNTLSNTAHLTKNGNVNMANSIDNVLVKQQTENEDGTAKYADIDQITMNQHQNTVYDANGDASIQNHNVQNLNLKQSIDSYLPNLQNVLLHNGIKCTCTVPNNTNKNVNYVPNNLPINEYIQFLLNKRLTKHDKYENQGPTTFVGFLNNINANQQIKNGINTTTFDDNYETSNGSVSGVSQQVIGINNNGEEDENMQNKNTYSEFFYPKQVNINSTSGDNYIPFFVSTESFDPVYQNYYQQYLENNNIQAIKPNINDEDDDGDKTRIDSIEEESQISLSGSNGLPENNNFPLWPNEGNTNNVQTDSINYETGSFTEPNGMEVVDASNINEYYTVPDIIDPTGGNYNIKMNPNALIHKHKNNNGQYYVQTNYNYEQLEPSSFVINKPNVPKLSHHSFGQSEINTYQTNVKGNTNTPMNVFNPSLYIENIIKGKIAPPFNVNSGHLNHGHVKYDQKGTHNIKKYNPYVNIGVNAQSHSQHSVSDDIIHKKISSASGEFIKNPNGDGTLVYRYYINNKPYYYVYENSQQPIQTSYVTHSYKNKGQIQPGQSAFIVSNEAVVDPNEFNVPVSYHLLNNVPIISSGSNEAHVISNAIYHQSPAGNEPDIEYDQNNQYTDQKGIYHQGQHHQGYLHKKYHHHKGSAHSGQHQPHQGHYGYCKTCLNYGYNSTYTESGNKGKVHSESPYKDQYESSEYYPNTEPMDEDEKQHNKNKEKVPGTSKLNNMINSVVVTQHSGKKSKGSQNKYSNTMVNRPVKGKSHLTNTLNHAEVNQSASEDDSRSEESTKNKYTNVMVNNGEAPDDDSDSEEEGVNNYNNQMFNTAANNSDSNNMSNNLKQVVVNQE